LIEDHTARLQFSSMQRFSLPMAFIALAYGKGPCSDYFGEGTDDGDALITVIDPDNGQTQGTTDTCSKNNVPAPCTFVHFSGPGSTCLSPGPRDDFCHRYMKVTYSKCPPLEEETAFDWAVSVDVKGRFDTTTGVLIECKDFVTSKEVTCWTYPKEEPVPCDCPPVEVVDPVVAPLATGSMPEDVDNALALGEVAVETDALENGLLDEASKIKTTTHTWQTSLAACVFMAAMLFAAMVAWSFRLSASRTSSTQAPEE